MDVGEKCNTHGETRDSFIVLVARISGRLIGSLLLKWFLNMNVTSVVKAKGRTVVELHLFLISAQDGCDWSPKRPGHLISGETAPGAH